MNAKIIACAFWTICFLSIFTFGQNRLFQNIFDFKNESFEFEALNPQSSYQHLQITEDIAMSGLLRLIASFEKQANKQIKEGHERRAEFLRSYLQRKAGLTFEQAEILKDYALKFTTEFGCITTRGEFDIRAKNNTETQNNERSQTLLEYRQRIRRLWAKAALMNLIDLFGGKSLPV